MSFVHLRTHTEFSVVDGTLRVDDAVNAAARDGQPACANAIAREYGSSPVEHGTHSTRKTSSGCASFHGPAAWLATASVAARSRKNHVSGTTTETMHD